MKNSMKNLSIYFIAIFATSLIFAKKALAVCPICTVAVGAGVGLSRCLGIDDSITGLWDRCGCCAHRAQPKSMMFFLH